MNEVEMWMRRQAVACRLALAAAGVLVVVNVLGRLRRR